MSPGRQGFPQILPLFQQSEYRMHNIHEDKGKNLRRGAEKVNM